MTKDEALKLALEAMEDRSSLMKWQKAINAVKAALEAKDEETELEKDAVNLLFALHDAWPYVHRHCTIEAKKKSIQALIVKHGDFADLHPPRTWQGLPPDEFKYIASKYLLNREAGLEYFQQELETKLRELNQ
jgi:hypothetical protein